MKDAALKQWFNEHVEVYKKLDHCFQLIYFAINLMGVGYYIFLKLSDKGNNITYHLRFTEIWGGAFIVTSCILGLLKVLKPEVLKK